MKQEELARLFHDLRSPLARAQTYGKLIEDANPAELADLVSQLNKALADLQALLTAAEDRA